MVPICLRYSLVNYRNVNLLLNIPDFLKLQIINQCPKLERIHLEGEFIESLLFSNLAECLSSASNLRDIRYLLLRLSF